LAVLVVGLVLTAAGCGTNDSPTQKKLKVTATTTMVGDIVKLTLGDAGEVTVIMGPGVDPHTFKPSTADLAAIKRADVVFYSGLHLEGKLVELLEHALGDRAVAVTRDIPHDRLLSWKEGQGGAYDPHVWFDVQLWSIAAKTVTETLAARLPEQAAAVRTRGEALATQMLALDAYVKQKALELPAEQRVLITSHDAYSYFGKAYGFDVRGIQGISTETEAAVASVQAAVDFIVARKIKSIFVESSVPPATIERVQGDCLARGVSVTIGGELYSDAMGVPGERPGYAVETYDGTVRYNIDTIIRGLKGASK